MPHWKGKRVVVTAGPTREPLDPVRFLSNASSGRMGYAVAAEARRRGARVVLVTGPTAITPPRGVRVVRVTTARQMLSAVLRHAARAHAVIGAAAVADWRPAALSRGKLKKSASPRALRLVPNPDILRTVALRRRRGLPRLVGFALETGGLLANALGKLRKKSLDLVVANTPAALDGRRTEAWLIGRSGRRERFRGSKAALAGRLLDAAAREAPDGR
jgi:phosphopantothenoylcysteine decarboxylase/phosphopantothenate--cysteine ligase